MGVGKFILTVLTISASTPRIEPKAVQFVLGQDDWDSSGQVTESRDSPSLYSKDNLLSFTPGLKLQAYTCRLSFHFLWAHCNNSQSLKFCICFYFLVYLYGFASDKEYRKTVPQIRAGEYEGLSEKVRAWNTI